MSTELSLEKIYQSALLFLSPSSIKKTYQIIVTEAVSLVGADYGSLFLLSPRKTFSRAFTTVPPPFRIKPRNNGFTYHTYKTGKPTVLNRKQVHQGHPNSNINDIQSLIIIPLTYKKVSVGVLVLQSSHKSHFTQDRFKTLKLFGSIASLAIYKAQLYQQTHQSLKDKNDFIEVTAHEIRTPLTIISNYISLLAKRNINPPEWITSLSQANIRLKHLVDVLTYSSNIHYLKKNVNHQIIYLDEILDQVQKYYIQKNLKQHLEFHIDCPQNQHIILGNYQHITQLLTYLIDNSIKYTPPQKTITVNCQTKSNRIVINVTDQGKGINAVDLPKIFNKYYQAEGQSQSGLGLGLYVVKKIASEHRGKISIKSKSGHGTTISISFPRIH